MADNEEGGVLDTAGSVLGWGFRTFIWDTNDSLASNAVKLGLTGAAVIAAPFSLGGSFAARGAITVGANLLTKAPLTARALTAAGEGIAAISTKVAPKLRENLSFLFKAPVVNKATGIATGDTKFSLGRTASTLGAATFATGNMDSATEVFKTGGSYVYNQAAENLDGVNRVLGDPLGQIQAAMNGTTAPQNSFTEGVGGNTGLQVVDVPMPEQTPAPAPEQTGPGGTTTRQKRQRDDETSFDLMRLLKGAGNNPLPILTTGLGFMMGGPMGAMVMAFVGYMLNKTNLGRGINNWMASGIKDMVNDASDTAQSLVIKDKTKPDITTEPNVAPAVDVQNSPLIQVRAHGPVTESTNVRAFDDAVNNRVQPPMATAIPAHLVPGATSTIAVHFDRAVTNDPQYGDAPQEQNLRTGNNPALTPVRT